MNLHPNGLNWAWISLCMDFIVLAFGCAWIELRNHAKHHANAKHRDKDHAKQHTKDHVKHHATKHDNKDHAKQSQDNLFMF